jgi:hypothetical protein
VIRRYENIIKDKTRNQIIQGFLWHYLEELFPKTDYSTHLVYVSSIPITLLPPYPRHEEDCFGFSNLFSYKKFYLRFTELTNETSFFLLLKIPIQIHSITIASCENDFPFALTVREGFSLSTLFQLCTRFVFHSASERNFLGFPIK